MRFFISQQYLTENYMMKKSVMIIAGIAATVVIIILILIGKAVSQKGGTNLYVESKRGQFDIVVTVTGELQAENSVNISGPDFTQARGVRIMDLRIQDIVPEGTEVEVGDYIATLDRTTLDNTLRDELERLITYETNLETGILDTSVNLSNLRDGIRNQEANVEEARITLEQSQFEPPATIRQAEIALGRNERSLEQALRSYELRVEQSRSQMRNLEKNVSDQIQRVSDIERILDQFIITAPSPGMVIYRRDRSGNRIRSGSTINAFDRVVATLPDMSSMLSRTYVNEIDVSKVSSGQKVEIQVDAFPEKSYTGTVLSIANIGEQLPNTDAKVFEALIRVDGSDPILKPSMTTANKIVTQTISDVIFLPIESVHIGADSIPFVYLRNGTKQIVVTGEMNENHVIIEQGLGENVLVFLNTPENPEGFKLAGQELVDIIREREQAKRDEERRIREEAERSRNVRTTVRGRGQGQGGGQNASPEMRQRIQQAINNSGDTALIRELRQNMPQGDSTVVRLRDGGPQQGNQQQQQGARVREGGGAQQQGNQPQGNQQQPAAPANQ